MHKSELKIHFYEDDFSLKFSLFYTEISCGYYSQINHYNKSKVRLKKKTKKS